ncbi:MAG: HigA family addiction module antidote protein [Dysgonamonadaceae bacterium]|jgi:addiction module HigA family antidote|nr:HigA family addiction module antidote protein [Dysgonamonadaceae bacterium]
MKIEFEKDYLRELYETGKTTDKKHRYQPFRPYHPGELLKDELEYRHLSQREVAKQLGLPYTAFNEILNGKRPVTTDFALYMEAALGIPAYMLVGMQTDYNLQMAQKDNKLNERLAEIRKMAASLF